MAEIIAMKNREILGCIKSEAGLSTDQVGKLLEAVKNIGYLVKVLSFPIKVVDGKGVFIVGTLEMSVDDLHSQFIYQSNKVETCAEKLKAR